MKKCIFFFAMLADLFVMGCSGGGNNDGTPGSNSTNDGTPGSNSTNGQALGFLCSGLGETQVTSGGNIIAPDLGVDPHGKVSLRFDRSGNDVLVAVNIDSPLSTVFGYGFYIAYDHTVVQFEGYEPGTLSFLGNESNTNLQIKDQMTTLGASKDIFGGCGTSISSVIIGHSISGYAASGVSGNGTLGILRFRMTVPGKAKFLLRNFRMYSRAGSEKPAESPVSYPQAMLEFSG